MSRVFKLKRGLTAAASTYINSAGQQSEIVVDASSGSLWVRNGTSANTGYEFPTTQYANDTYVTGTSTTYASSVDTASYASNAGTITYPNNLSSVTSTSATASTATSTWIVSNSNSTVTVSIPWMKVEASGLVSSSGVSTVSLVCN